MARYVIGDVQGCHEELQALLRELRFSADRDELWFAGDLVNRGPESLEVLRFVRDLGGNAITVLGNHDLHLLALWQVPGRKARRSDTLDAVLAAKDRDGLLEWLLARPLVHHLPREKLLLVHAGLLPQWTAADATAHADEVRTALAKDAQKVLAGMYGNEPDRWDDALRGTDRWRTILNVLVRMRFCTPDGRLDMDAKGTPHSVRAPLAPWFRHPRASAGTRVIFGHWSALGFHDADDVLCLDTGCVWGAKLTAYDLDSGRRHSVPCRPHQKPGAEG